MSGAKSSGFAYFFALIGGVFGAHHLYLGRTQHALLWLTTFGGFGLGALYDLFYGLKQYVQEENNEEFAIEQYEKKAGERKSPAFELKRFFGQSIIAAFYGFVTYYAFPDTWHQNSLLSLLIGCCTAFAIAVGIYLTGTLGPRQCSFVWPLLGAILGLPFLMGSQDRTPALNSAAFISSWIFEWKIDWKNEYFPKKSQLRKKQRPRSHLLKRGLVLAAGGILFGLILTSAVYQNFQVDINGERMKVKDVLGDFFRSQEFVQLYQQLSIVGKELYAFYRQYGLKGLWTQIWTQLNSENDRQALGVLELYSGASQDEIEFQCRTLSRKWHPDRYRNPEEKQKAEATFMNIQQACNRLSQERRRRQMLNTQKRENPT